MAQDFVNRDVNYTYWPGPNAAGMNKATIPAVQSGVDTAGMRDTIWHGRNCAGNTKGGANIGPNAIGQPDYPSKT